MKKKILYLLSGSAFVALFGILGTQIYVRGASCGANCSKKEIGTYSFGNFAATDKALIKDRTYWVKLTIKGQDKTTTITPTPPPTPPETTATGNDIMLVMDTTGSMATKMKKYKSSTNKEMVTRLEAARDSLQKFVELSDDNPQGGIDYLGLGSFKSCGNYSNNAVPIEWAYQSVNAANNKMTGNGVLHLKLQNFQGKKELFNNTIDQMLGQNAFCIAGNGISAGETDIGAGMTIGNTQLSPILNSTSGSAFRSSNLGFSGYNDGPKARDMSGTKIPKYIVLATDGEENVSPRVYEQEIDKAGTTVDAAKRYNIKVYTLLIGDVNNTNASNLLKRIATETGGKYFSGNSEEELLDSYTAIRNEITNNNTPPPTAQPTTTITGTKSTLQENINASNFKIFPLTKDATFVLKKKTANGTITTITDSCGSDLKNCVTTSSDGSFTANLPAAADGEEIYVYFMVTPTAIGKDIKVDQDSSTLTYEGRAPVQLDNIVVDIVQALPYFETQGGGDTYSFGGIKVNLPDAGSFFSRGNPPGLVLHSGNAVFQPGKVSSKGWKVAGYSDPEDKINYNSLIRSVKNIQDIGTSPLGQSGFYHAKGDLEIKPNTLPGLNNKQYTIFVDGNLYIRSGVNIPSDGKSLVVFIVAKNIGIDPAVKSTKGVYITDGKIDTACIGSFAGAYCSPNSPNLDDSQLTAEGLFYAASGFNLDRRGNSATSLDTPIPGEKFIYRPEYLLPAGNMLGTIDYLWQEITP